VQEESVVECGIIEEGASFAGSGEGAEAREESRDGEEGCGQGYEGQGADGGGEPEDCVSLSNMAEGG
jgi:hypothetical protein